MISKIRLKSGRTPNAVPTEIDVATVNIFVGPNNSGKSRILREINDITNNNFTNNIIIGDIEFAIKNSSIDEMIDLIRTDRKNKSDNDVIIKNGIKRIKDTPRDTLIRIIKDPNLYRDDFCRLFLSELTLFIDGKTRLNLTNESGASDLQKSPTSILDIFFRDNDKREKIRELLFEAFGEYFVIDPTNIGKLRIRFSKIPPKDEVTEKGLHSDAVEFHNQANNIEAYSDGVKSFTGIIMSIISNDDQLIIIDEPEAFLHPSLAFSLGKYIASNSIESNERNIFVSTHSSNFIMGCIQSGLTLNIIRLTYKKGLSTSRILDNQTLELIMKDPLLRSANTLNALFYDFVVITEADRDRAFYQEINDRLLQYKNDWGISNCLFLNAQNFQTIYKIIRPIRSIGIPAVGIFDIDILILAKNQSFKDIDNILSSSGMENHIQKDILEKIKKLNNSNIDRDNIKKNGINSLISNEYSLIQEIISTMSQYGLFVVPCGEVECWLPNILTNPVEKKKWLTSIFTSMGSNPSDPNYIKPTEDDVWKFIHSIKEWCMNPERKGIPD